MSFDRPSKVSPACIPRQQLLCSDSLEIFQRRIPRLTARDGRGVLDHQITAYVGMAYVDLNPAGDEDKKDTHIFDFTV